MRLQASFYFQPVHNDGSLLLQHYQIDKTPLCLACVCDAENPVQGKAAAYLTGQLLHWFRALRWKKLARRPEKYLSRMELQLQKILERIMDELLYSNLLSTKSQISLSGILCIGQYYLLFCKGITKIYLLNRDLGKGALQCISDDLTVSGNERITFLQGFLQTDIGLLFATESFCDTVTQQELKTCLHVKEIKTSDRAGRHLRELGRRGEVQGRCNMGAILIQTLPASHAGT